MVRRRAKNKLRVGDHVERIDEAERQNRRAATYTLDGQAEGGTRIEELGKNFEGGAPIMPGDGVVITKHQRKQKPKQPVQKKRKKKAKPTPKKAKKKKKEETPPPLQGGDLYKETRANLHSTPELPQTLGPPSVADDPSPLLPPPASVSSYAPSVRLPSPAPISEDSVSVVVSEDVIDDSQNFYKTGSCRRMTQKEWFCLCCVVVFGAIIVAVSLLVLSADNSEEAAADEPSVAEILPGVVEGSLTTYVGVALAQSFPIVSLRENGLKIFFKKTSGGAFAASGSDTTSTVSVFSEKVVFYSNITTDVEANGFASHIDSIYANGVYSFSETLISVFISNLTFSSIKSYTAEGVKIWLEGEGADGLPFEFTLEPEVLALPQDAEKQIADPGSKAAAVASVLSTSAAIGTAASVGALPRLHMIASAFDCPSTEFFEVDWVTHPLDLIGFPDIDIGNYPELAKHISAVVAGFIILAAAFLLLFMVSIPFKMKHGDWVGAFSTVGFPHYVLAVYAFICPGLAVCSMQVLYYHPNVGAQVFGAFGFLMLCIAPLVGILYILFSTYFNAGMVGIPGGTFLSRFLLGSREWESEDATFIGRYALLFQDYGVNAKGFILLELGVSVVFGIVEGVRPEERSGCMWRSWALLIVNTVHLCALLFLKPLLALFELLFAFIMAAASEVILFLVVLNQHENSREHWTADAAGYLTVASLWMIRVKCVLDLLVFLYELFINRNHFEGIEEEEPSEKPRELEEVHPQIRVAPSAPSIASTPRKDFTELTIIVAGREFSTDHPGRTFNSPRRTPGFQFQSPRVSTQRGGVGGGGIGGSSLNSSLAFGSSSQGLTAPLNTPGDYTSGSFAVPLHAMSPMSGMAPL